MDSGSSTAGFWRSKAFRPFWAWILLSTILLALQFHRRQEQKASLAFTVGLQGRERPTFKASLNGEPFHSGGHSGLGTKRLTIEAPEAETFHTNVFVGYGGKNLGDITLARTRGQLQLTVQPAAARVSVDGREARKDFHSITQELLSLPTGRYQVTVAFARFATNTTVEILPHQTHRLSFVPDITTLHLVSQPTNAEFEVSTAAIPEIFIRSNTPAVLTDMPAGHYRLSIWRGEYQKTVGFQLIGELSTNDLKVEFDYAKLAVTSEPPGASIRNGERLLGTTPTNLTLPTGLYHLLIAKEEFRGTNLSLDLSRNETRSIHATLPNAAYSDAFDRAQEFASATPPNFTRALAEVDKALEAKPGDEPALALKRQIEFGFHLDQAAAFGRIGNFVQALTEVEAALALDSTDASASELKARLSQSKHDAEVAAAEARRNRPLKYIESETKAMPHSILFPVETMRFAGSIEAARAAVARALARKPEFSIVRNEKPDEQSSAYFAEWKSLAARQHVVLMAAQTADNEVTICFKLFIYTLDTAIRLDGDNYRPLHPQHVSAFRAPFVEKQRASDLQAFKKRIEEELP